MKALFRPEPTDPADRRQRERHRLVLRVGLLERDGNVAFCLLKNISPTGVQVRLFASIDQGTNVCLRVGDEDALDGRVAWVRGANAGISFKTFMAPDTLLRVRQILSSTRRRSSPRVSAFVRATLRTGGRTYAAELCDISASGAKIRTAMPVESEGIAILDLRDLPGLRAYVRWVDGANCGLAFESPIPIQTIAKWLNQRGSARLA